VDESGGSKSWSGVAGENRELVDADARKNRQKGSPWGKVEVDGEKPSAQVNKGKEANSGGLHVNREGFGGANGIA